LEERNVPKPRFINEQDVINSFADISLEKISETRTSLIEKHQQKILEILDANRNDIILPLDEDTSNNITKTTLDKFTNDVQAKCNSFMEKVIFYSPSENLEAIRAKHQHCCQNECQCKRTS
jgi:hypothetical protein